MLCAVSGAAAAWAARMRCWWRWAGVSRVILGSLDVLDHCSQAEVFNDVGFVAGLVVGNAVVLGLVLHVTAACAVLVVNGQVAQGGDQHGAVREEWRVNNRQAAQPGAGQDAL